LAVAIVTFANRAMAHMHWRFRRQVRRFGVFEKSFVWTESDLSPAFRRDFAAILSPSVKGFGYWVWKPQVVLQALKQLELGDVLVYLDSGSHINPGGMSRFWEYVDAAKFSPAGVLAFRLDFLERDWTKADLLEYFSVRNCARYIDSGQIQAGALVIFKKPDTEQFFRNWLAPFYLDVGLVDDSQSRVPEVPGFLAHRHDQSVFSLLAKQRNIRTFSANEQFPYPANMTWDDLAATPFHHKRDKKTIWMKLRIWADAASMPLQITAVRAKARLGSFVDRRKGV
jgi:hypothetical protein